MKDMGKWQLVSMLSRMIAMGLGIFQSFFILRILTVGQWGVVQLAVAIGGALGIYQHLGLSSGSTREIAASKDQKDVFKIFVTSISIRYLITLPIAVGLYFLSEEIALTQYQNPQLILPLKIYAAVLLFQGMQGLFNSIVSGMKRFKTLFIYQGAIAFVSVVLYVPLVYLYKINGFFYAMLSFNILATLVLGSLALAPIKNHLSLPSWEDYRRIFKELFSISIAIYVVKVLFTLWEKSGPLLLGYEVSEEAIGLFAFAVLFAKKLVHVSDAVTDINLPVLSDTFINNLKDYRAIFVKNFNYIFAFLVFSGTSAAFWSKELVSIVVGSAKYNPALPLIVPLVFTFIFYSLINILKSSVFVPGKFVKEMVFGFSLMLITTVAAYFGLWKYGGFTNVSAMGIGMLIGSLLSFWYLVESSHKLLGFVFFKHDHVLLLIQGLFFALAKDVASFWQKVVLYLILSAFYVSGLFIAQIVTKKQVIETLKSWNILKIGYER